MFNLGQTRGSCGCEQGCPTACPTYQQCNQVVQTCNVQDVPHYTNFHMHTVNNCIKRHINIPTYSASQETVLQDQYVDVNPMMYNQPMGYGYPGQMPYQAQMASQYTGSGWGNTNMMYNQQMGQLNPMQYQGNVGTENPMMYQQPTMPTNYPGMNMQFNY